MGSKTGAARGNPLGFRDADSQRFNNAFGGDSTVAGLLAHVAKPGGGVDSASGRTPDPNFDLVAAPWVDRFRPAGLVPLFQCVQVRVATADAQTALDQIKARAALIASQGGIGFLFDVANQHGAGGALAIYAKVFACRIDRVGPALRDESVRRVSAQFGANSPEAGRRLQAGIGS
jgi:hypothetical protein